MAERSVQGHVAVLGRRLEALKGAIERANLSDTKFVYDQVLRAFEKLEDLLREDGGATADVTQPTLDVYQQAAAETDTFSFEITNVRPGDKDKTVSIEALEATAEQVSLWVGARLMHRWNTTGVAPKFAKVDVKVGVE